MLLGSGKHSKRLWVNNGIGYTVLHFMHGSSVHLNKLLGNTFSLADHVPPENFNDVVVFVEMEKETMQDKPLTPKIPTGISRVLTTLGCPKKSLFSKFQYAQSVSHDAYD